MKMKSYAGFWQRVKAFSLDYAILLIYLVVILGIGLLGRTHSPWFRSLFSNRVLAQLIAFLLVTLPITIYFAVSESSPRQATWGKQKLGIQLMDSDGMRISFGKAFLRTLLKFVPWEIAHTLVWQIRFFQQITPAINGGLILVYTLVGLNILSLVLTKTHQTLYDLATKTYVIKTSTTPAPTPET
jgi:uncharacterized RDD family membrane protein YckC